ERADAGRGAQGFVVREHGGDEHRTACVVLAVSLAAARELLAGPAPAAAEALASMRAESLVALVHAYRRADVAHPLRGLRLLGPKSAGGLVRGTLFSSSIDAAAAPAGHVLLRSLLGGARHPEAVELGDEELRRRVADECRWPLGLSAAPVFTRIERHPAVIPR